MMATFALKGNNILDSYEPMSDNVEGPEVYSERYTVNERFREGLSSTDPRTWYRMWVEHWIRGEHRRRIKLARTLSPRCYCTGCGASITTTDVEAGECTQCHAPVMV